MTPSDLAIGECFAVPTGDGTSVNLVTLEACADPHELEVVGRLIDPAAPEASYRGSDAIRSLASAACSSAFEDYVGIAPMGSNLDAWMFAPSETSWVSGDRTVICAAGEPGRASLTGSVFDTRR